MGEPTLDCWAEWLVRTRFTGLSEDEAKETFRMLEEVRERVLDRARLRPDDVVVDVGTGTGLLARGALERLGEDGLVLAIDVSADCLDELRRVNKDPRVWYEIGAAEVLPLPDESTDVVLTRSVLMYVRDKAEAAREFYRVLRPGGRFSIFEPINSRAQRFYDAIDFGPLHDRVVAAASRRYPPDDPMLDFVEDDLQRFFADAGFAELDAELRPNEQPIRPDRLLESVGAPGKRSILDDWREAFEPEEVEQLVATVRAQESLDFRLPVLFLAGVKR